MDSDSIDSPSTFSGKLDLSRFAFTSPYPPSPTQTPKRPSTSPKPPTKRPRTNPPRLAPTSYTHLPLLPDALSPNLYILFVGLNPGLQTSRTGHAYAHPSNLFWKLLYSSGITPSRLDPFEDQTLPGRFRLGLTNIVERPSRNGAELSKAEMDMGVAALDEKARRTRAEVVCIVGKSVWESVWRVRHGRGIRKEEFQYGWQRETENMGYVSTTVEDSDKEEPMEKKPWKGSRVFVATSTSGLAATLKPAEKQLIWRELGIWLESRRIQESDIQESQTASPGLL